MSFIQRILYIYYSYLIQINITTPISFSHTQGNIFNEIHCYVFRMPRWFWANTEWMTNQQLYLLPIVFTSLRTYKPNAISYNTQAYNTIICCVLLETGEVSECD
jgi:hypothetical protein